MYQTITCVLAFIFISANCIFSQSQDLSESNTENELNPIETSKRLDEMIFTASRKENKSFNEPVTVHVVDEKEIQQYLHRTIPESLKREPGILIQKTGNGQGSPFLRGFTSYRNLFLIDGIRLNNSVFREGPNQYWNTVDALSLKRLEIVKGPSSTLYGSDAIGGTVNAITLSPFDYATSPFGGRLYSRVSSAESSAVGRLELYGVLDDTFGEELGYMIGITGKEFGNVVGGNDVGKQPNTGYDEYDLDFKLESYLNSDTRWVLAYQRVRLNNAPRTHRTVYGIPWSGLSIGSDLRRDLDQDRDLIYTQLHLENLDSFIDAAHFSLSYHQHEEIRDRIRGNGNRELQGFDVGQIGAFTQLESYTNFGDWVYGVEFYHDNVNSFSSRNAIQGPVADNASYDLVGAYIQDTIPLFDDRLDFIIGGRFTYAEAIADRVQDPISGNQISLQDDWSNVVGNARFLWHIDSENHWNGFVGVSQGFRAPNLSDLTRLDSARTNEIETAALGLDPEQYLTYEIGVKTEYDTIAAQLSYFYTDIDDQIIRFPTGNTINGEFEITKDNLGDGFIHGVEVQGSWEFYPQWTVFTSATWIEGEINTYPTSAQILRKEPVSRLMPTIGQIGLRWDHSSDKIWIEGLLTISEAQNNLSTRDLSDTSRIPPGGTPGYEILSLYSGFQLKDNFTVSFAVENIWDEDYRIHGSGINEPGLNFSLGMEYRF